LFFDDDDRVVRELGEIEIEIEVKATGMNFRDVMMVCLPQPIERCA
jgi:hypothetical protein